MSGWELLAQVPFVHPLTIPPGARMWFFLPLAFCVAVVYRATRARSTEGLLRGALITFLNIVVGMAAIAIAAYGLHQAVLYFWP